MVLSPSPMPRTAQFQFHPVLLSVQAFLDGQSFTIWADERQLSVEHNFYKWHFEIVMGQMRLWCQHNLMQHTEATTGGWKTCCRFD